MVLQTQVLEIGEPIYIVSTFYNMSWLTCFVWLKPCNERPHYLFETFRTIRKLYDGNASGHMTFYK